MNALTKTRAFNNNSRKNYFNHSDKFQIYHKAGNGSICIENHSISGFGLNLKSSLGFRLHSAITKKEQRCLITGDRDLLPKAQDAVVQLEKP